MDDVICSKTDQNSTHPSAVARVPLVQSLQVDELNLTVRALEERENRTLNQIVRGAEIITCCTASSSHLQTRTRLLPRSHRLYL